MTGADIEQLQGLPNAWAELDDLENRLNVEQGALAYAEGVKLGHAQIVTQIREEHQQRLSAASTQIRTAVTEGTLTGQDLVATVREFASRGNRAGPLEDCKKVESLDGQITPGTPVYYFGNRDNTGLYTVSDDPEATPAAVTLLDPERSLGTDLRLGYRMTLIDESGTSRPALISVNQTVVGTTAIAEALTEELKDIDTDNVYSIERA